MKNFKKFATFCLASVFTLGAGAILAGCKDKKDSETSSVYSKECYTFILKDSQGKPVQGVNVQLCDTANNGACDMPHASDASGKVEYKPAWGEGEFDIHLWDSAMSNQYEFTGAKKTPAAYAEISLVVNINN